MSTKSCASKESIFDMYDIDNNKTYIKGQFCKNGSFFDISASLASEFRLDSLWFGLASSKFDDEVENALMSRCSVQRRKQMKKDFLFYMENVDEIKNVNHETERLRQLCSLMTRHRLYLPASWGQVSSLAEVKLNQNGWNEKLRRKSWRRRKWCWNYGRGHA